MYQLIRFQLKIAMFYCHNFSSKEEGYSGSNSSDESDGGRTKPQNIKKPLEKRNYYDHPEKYRKTLRLSSDQIVSLKCNFH